MACRAPRLIVGATGLEGLYEEVFDRAGLLVTLRDLTTLPRRQAEVAAA